MPLPPTPSKYSRFTVEQLASRYMHHPPRGDQGSRYERVRAAILSCAMAAVDLTPVTPEQTRGLNALDEAMFLFNAAIARGEISDETPGMGMAGSAVSLNRLNRVKIVNPASVHFGWSGRLLELAHLPGLWWVGIDTAPNGDRPGVPAPPQMFNVAELTVLMETSTKAIDVDDYLDECATALRMLQAVSEESSEIPEIPPAPSPELPPDPAATIVPPPPAADAAAVETVLADTSRNPDSIPPAPSPAAAAISSPAESGESLGAAPILG